MRYLLPVLSALVLSACQAAQDSSSNSSSSNRELEVAKPITLSARQISSVRAGVTRVLQNHDLEAPRFGRMLAGRTSKAVVVCGYVDGKDSSG